MKFINTLNIAFVGLKTNFIRSVFIILGVAVGIAAIILILALGDGATNLVIAQAQGLGSRTMFVLPGKASGGGTHVAALFSKALKKSELNALLDKTRVPNIVDITPDILVPGRPLYENRVSQATIVGTGPHLSDLLNVYPAKGTLFTQSDVDQLSKVAVIGSDVKADLFGDSEAIGQKIKIKGVNFKVIGVFDAEGTVSLFNVDKGILIPYSAAQKYLLGSDYFNEFLIRIDNEANMERTRYDIIQTLRELHNITDSSKDDFSVQTQADLVARLSVITNILTALLVAVATVSLVVGGIGIMNIMLVSVSERTREIGLRKALGATEQNIMSQFLFEAMLLTGAGGIVGIIIGGLLAFIVASILSFALNLDWQFGIPLGGILSGVVISLAIGLVFGIYPARKASKKSPIEALRYE